MANTPPQLLLGHGASGTAISMKPWVDALKQRGVAAVALELPRSNTDKAVDVFRKAHAAEPSAALGGHSFGGRMASLLAAEDSIPALVLLSYPLHRPGHPEDLRTEHWRRITCPVLLLSGERDPFAKTDLLLREVKKLKHAQLFTYPNLGHGLLPVVDDATDKIVEFLGSQAA
jgi:predicted alpha/beta-hydrolase family hydrolase